MIRFGVHCSLKKGLTGALEEARELGCESLQIFTRSPRMWRMRIPSAEQCTDFAALRRQLGIFPLVVHTPYLPNLATAKEKLYRLSCDSLRDDLTVMEMLGADYLVIHPGAWSEGSSPEAGMKAIIDGMKDALEQVPGRAVILLENVAGGGRRLGGSFRELATLIDGVGRANRIGVCLDTAHAFGAGYDVSRPEGVDAMLEEFDREVGRQYLKVIHCNDSLVPLGSRKDRHQHLGKGEIGSRGFRHLISRVRDSAEAGILETPKNLPDADRTNLRLLFKWRDRQTA